MKPVARILIADREEAVRTLISRILSPWKPELIFAEDGIHAMILAVQNEPDLFLIDHELADMSGVDLAGDLRLDGRFAESRIFILSYDREPPARTGETRAWDGWIEKPFDVLRLRDQILSIQVRRSLEPGSL